MPEYHIFRFAAEGSFEAGFRRFEQNMTNEFRRGWEPVGGISITQYANSDGSTLLLLAQAAVKRS